MQLTLSLQRLYFNAMGWLSRLGDKWLLGLLARFIFASTLYFYFINSALLKISDGLFGFLSLSTGAYYQILPQVMAANGGDTSAIAFPYLVIAYAGTYAEFILPTLIVLGLFTRFAALGMIGFIAVQTYVDIMFHHADSEAIGNMFDRVQDSAISDQRLMWVFLLAVLVIKGAGVLSLDWLFVKRR